MGIGEKGNLYQNLQKNPEGTRETISDLRRSEDYLKLLHDAIEVLPIGITISNVDGKIIYTNSAEAALHGYTREELLGNDASSLGPQGLSRRPSPSEMSTWGSWRRETTNVTKDGNEFPVYVSSIVVRDSGGRPLGFVTTCEDITERKRLQDKILQAKVEWESTFNTISEAITVHDRDFNILLANKAAEELLGRASPDLFSRKCFSSYHGTASPPQRCPSCETMKTGIASTTELYEPHLKKYLEIRALPRFDQDRRLIGVVHVVRDITQRREAEEERKSLELQLLQSQKMDSIGRLAGGIAHDFNNILSAIIGFSDLALLRLAKGQKVTDYLTTIREAGERAAVLTRQLLAFSRKQVLKKEIVDLHNLIDNTTVMLSRIIGEDIRLNCLKTSSASTIMADPQQIEQVLMNLMINARDAMSAGGTLTITTSVVDGQKVLSEAYACAKPGCCIMLEVCDTGTGMPIEVQEHIFEPFFTTKAPGKGTGLGLATVYGIVKQHNGAIEVDSEVKKGTTFRVYLPLADGTASATHRTVPEDLPRGAETILVVDDDPMILKLAAEILESLGYKVIIKARSQEAVGFAAAFADDIHLLLSDVIMPEMNGMQLRDEILRLRPRIKIAFMSGYADDMLSHLSGPGSREVLIEKPMTPRRLAQQVREILDGPVQTL